jgi:hypothetical protein
MEMNRFIQGPKEAGKRRKSRHAGGNQEWAGMVQETVLDLADEK